MVENERRGAAFNVANFTTNLLTATVRFSATGPPLGIRNAKHTALPDGRAPDYVSVREVEYVAMQSGSWHADALPVAPRGRDGWSVTLHPGVSRQLWFDFHTRNGPPPGTYKGEVVVEEKETGHTVGSKMELTIEPFRLPDEHTLALTMWDYTAADGHYAMNRNNIPAAVAHMRSYGYNAPWATTSVFPVPKPEDFDEKNELVTALDYTLFDEWVAMWPNPRYYMVFVEALVGRHQSNPFADTEAGTEAFNRRLGSTIKAWADNAKKAGIEPSQLALLLIDEPGGIEQAERILSWAKAIKAAVPEIVIYEDTHLAPDNRDARAMLEICDILCPAIGTYREGGKKMADGFEELRKGGRELWLYSSPTLEADIYYRDHAWTCWKAKATGLGFWAYGDAGGRGNSWNQVGATGPIYTPVYIDSKSVTDGKHWLAIIEGIQDYEYLRLLRDRVEETGDREAKKLIESLPDKVLEGEISFDEARENVLDALLSLAGS